MAEMETVTMKANSSVFNVVSNSEETEGDDILMEEQEENGDEAVPDDFDESEAADDQRVLMLADRISRWWHPDMPQH